MILNCFITQRIVCNILDNKKYITYSLGNSKKITNFYIDTIDCEYTTTLYIKPCRIKSKMLRINDKLFYIWRIEVG